MIQDILTYCIISIAVVFAVYRIFRTQFSAKKQSGCGGCSGEDNCAGCPLKDMKTIKEKK